MDFRVPPDCKDSPFHYKWRLHMLEHVKKETFWRQPEPVRLAVKKFLDHPTSLPYDHQKVDNFMTNSMIIVDREVLGWALKWFADVRKSFFAALKKSSFVPAEEMPYTPPPKPDGKKPTLTDSFSSLSIASTQAGKEGADAEETVKSGRESEQEPIPSKFEILMVFPARWPFHHVVGHVLVMGEDTPTKNIVQVNRCVASITFDSADEMIALINKDNEAKVSIYGKPRPRLYMKQETVRSLNLVTVQCTDKTINFNQDLVLLLKAELGKHCRAINMFHNWDGFVAIMDTPEAVDALVKRDLRDFYIGEKYYPIDISKGF